MPPLHAPTGWMAKANAEWQEARIADKIIELLEAIETMPMWSEALHEAGCGI